ncbi:hypothetical protein LDENG_00216990 [Lucifuga dentata]|nr:hypothetical protein LDENG_00216990 [Lucifuga dentata]
MEMIIHAFVSSQLDSCNSLFTSLSSSSLDCLQVVQNNTARLLTRSSKRSHSPAYISELLWPYATSRSLRSSHQGLLSVPRSRLKTKGDCAFEVMVPKLWNSLPLDLRTVDTVGIFKKKLNTHLFKLAFA